MAVAVARPGSSRPGESPAGILRGRGLMRSFMPATLLVGIIAIAYLSQASGLATTGYDIHRLQQERDAWRLRNEQLRLELAKARSLAWIEAQATSRLGMRPAQNAQYVTVAPLDKKVAASNPPDSRPASLDGGQNRGPVVGAWEEIKRPLAGLLAAGR